MKKIIYIDMDNTLADYLGMAKQMQIDPSEAKYLKGFFEKLQPMPNAIDSYNKLAEHFDVYILSTGPWSNPHSLYEKVLWVKQHLPKAYKNVIFSHHKDLNIGDYLIDDSIKNGAQDFHGKHIQIGSAAFPTWNDVLQYISEKENIQL
jgi:5'(3')-deoxyribonucleotidase